jgi:putative endonuclease
LGEGLRDGETQGRGEGKKRLFMKRGDGDRKPLGRRGEDVACRALKRAGYRLLEQNYQCPLGEIDIIARQGRTIVFVEVKSESGPRGILPKDRVDARKQRKMIQLAQFFLKGKRLRDVSARFDVVQVLFQEDRPPAVEIIVNAFEAKGS